MITMQTAGPRDWARRLKEREERGDHLTVFQRQAWRQALRVPVEDADRAVADRPS